MKILVGVALSFAVPTLVLTSVPGQAAGARASVRADERVTAVVLPRSKAPSTADTKRQLKPAMPRVEAGSALAEAILNRR